MFRLRVQATAFKKDGSPLRLRGSVFGFTLSRERLRAYRVGSRVYGFGLSVYDVVCLVWVFASKSSGYRVEGVQVQVQPLRLRVQATAFKKDGSLLRLRDSVFGFTLSREGLRA